MSWLKRLRRSGTRGETGQGSTAGSETAGSDMAGREMGQHDTGGDGPAPAKAAAAAARPPAAAPLRAERIAFSIAGEPDDGFLSQIALFDLALRRPGSPLRDARVIAHLGTDGAREIPARWRPWLERVDLRFVAPDPGHARSYFAQAMARFRLDEPGIDHVILCDADTLVLGDLSPVLGLLDLGVPVAGVIAHFPPPEFAAPNADWRRFATLLTGSAPRLEHAYTLLDPAAADPVDPPRAPFYVNHGFLPFRADALRAFCGPYLEMRARAVGHLERHPQFVGQLALTLTQHQLGWTPAALPMRYNFPNDAEALRLHAYEAQDIRVLHYLRERHFRRGEVVAGPEAFAAFLAADTGPADGLLRAALTSLTMGRYPFAGR